MDSAEECDLAILTVLQVELSAVLAAFNVRESDAETRNGRLYWRAPLGGGKGEPPLRVVIGVCNAAGTVSAALRTTRFLRDFSPSLLVLVGIAAGDKRKYKQGDVVWGAGVADVSMAQIEAGKVAVRPDVLPYPPSVAQLTRSFRCDAKQLHKGTNRVLTRMKRPIVPPTDNGKLKIFNETVATMPTVHDCIIGSGNLLVRDENKFVEYQEIHSKITAIEMEAAGMVAAISDGGFSVPWFVIRGISDFGDVNKDKVFDAQPYAAAAAAAYTRIFAQKSHLKVLLARSGAISLSKAQATSAVATSPVPATNVVVLSSTPVDASTAAATAFEQHIRDIRARWQTTPSAAVWEELRSLRQSPEWQHASTTDQAAALRLEAEIMLASNADGEAAKSVADEAEKLAGPDRALNARIASYRQGAAAAIACVSDPKNTAEWTMHISLLLDSGNAEAALQMIETPPDGAKVDAQTQRLRALAFLKLRKLEDAAAEITRARKAAPDNFAVRYASALTDYFAAISPAAPGEVFSLYPIPVPLELVKRDADALVHLNRAASEFAELSGVAASVPSMRRELETWEFAAIANNALRQEEASAKCKHLLEERPSDALILQWASERDYIGNSEAEIATLAKKLKIDL